MTNTKNEYRASFEKEERERTPPLRAKANYKTRLSNYTRGAIKDELVYQLSSTGKINFETLEFTHKYYKQAKYVLHRINIYEPSKPPVFIINCSDLTPSLIIELDQLRRSSAKQYDMLVTEAVQMLLEGVNSRYYHINGIAYKVKWRFEP
jgi:hypothetical protein